ncbi:MAG: SUMF1/EgtB/PvdO family nonheme iron enzyme [Devosia sp.]
MRWPSLLLPLLATLALGAPALAVSPVRSDPAKSPVYAQIRQQLAPEKSWALLIGVSDFDNAAWRHLGGVQPEVETVSKALTAQGFSIAPESHVGRMSHGELAKAISHFFETYGQTPDARLVVYVATHGYADPDNPAGDGYLIASDSEAPEGSAVERGYSVTELKSALSLPASRHIYMFFDSCFSGAMLPGPDRAVDTLLANKPGEALSPETAEWTHDLLGLNARLVLTAGNASETVPDGDSPFGAAVAAALAGEADMDGDGLILGSELAQYVRGRVARASRLANHPNDPVFAVIAKSDNPNGPKGIDAALQGDFIFLDPLGATPAAQQGIDEQAALLKEQQARLSDGQFLACVDCPTMVKLPGSGGKLALSSTEVTYAQWDACYRVAACQRYLPDDGFGRGDRPAANLTWLDALQYLSWLKTRSGDAPCISYRIPTLDEWRYAALYGTAGQVSWPQAVADGHPVCWGCGPGQDGVAAIRVASEPADAAGLYDMLGNVWEWVADGVAPNEPRCALEVINEHGACGDGRVVGGSFATRADAMAGIGDGGVAPRTGNGVRAWSSPAVGLRVACDVKPD